MTNVLIKRWPYEDRDTQGEHVKTEAQISYAAISPKKSARDSQQITRSQKRLGRIPFTGFRAIRADTLDFRLLASRTERL